MMNFFTRKKITKQAHRFTVLVALLAAFGLNARATAGKPAALNSGFSVVKSFYLSAENPESKAREKPVSYGAEPDKGRLRLPGKVNYTGEKLKKALETDFTDLSPYFLAEEGTYVASLLAPTINSYFPTKGKVGSRITITGTNLLGLTSFKIGNSDAAVISKKG